MSNHSHDRETREAFIGPQSKVLNVASKAVFQNKIPPHTEGTKDNIYFIINSCDTIVYSIYFAQK